MKVSEALKVIDDGWVKKPKGFRVHYQKRVNSEWIADYAPGEEENPLDSDVVAWRLAWKLSQAGKSNPPEISEGDMVNIYVVDESGDPVMFYGTNQPRVLNKREAV